MKASFEIAVACGLALSAPAVAQTRQESLQSYDEALRTCVAATSATSVDIGVLARDGWKPTADGSHEFAKSGVSILGIKIEGTTCFVNFPVYYMLKMHLSPGEISSRINRIAEPRLRSLAGTPFEHMWRVPGLLITLINEGRSTVVRPLPPKK